MKTYAQVRNFRGEQTAQPTITNDSRSTHLNTPTPKGLFAVFFLILIAWMAVSAALVYHWRKYGKGDKNVSIAQSIYFIGSVILLFIIIFSIL